MPDAVPAGPALDGQALAFVSGFPPRFGSLATINPDGVPLQAIVWYTARPDGVIVLNSKVGRQWPTNLLRDPRCSLMVGDEYEWVSIRGDVVAIDDREVGFEDIAAMARRYHATDAAKLESALARFRSDSRISFHLRPRQVTVHL
jgi:PPOX class probable F420-dependent enzyme